MTSIRLSSTVFRHLLPPTSCTLTPRVGTAFFRIQLRPFSSTSASPGKDDAPTRQRRFRRHIRTLDPAHLHPSDFIDLSARHKAIVWSVLNDELERSIVRYGGSPTTTRGPESFPEGTRGFLYYVPPDNPTGSGHVRFRVTKDSNVPRSFQDGHDLLLDDGVPWRLPPGLLAQPSTSGLAALIMQQQLATEEHIATWSLYPKTGRRPHEDAPKVERFGQPFPINFAAYRVIFWTKAEGSLAKVRIHFGFEPGRRPAFTQGTGIVCLEPLTSTKRKVERAAAIRILKITEPVEPRPELSHLHVPKEGNLLSSPRTGRPITFPIDGFSSGSRALRGFWEDHERREAESSTAVP
ncbi:hypothetical protein BC834DRAFT_45758 [Gloeopeniophorella convolvens]|nr:hypothetical protein BC834DRAFT_45758 [Gloeopeniophorella convolvens]